MPQFRPAECSLSSYKISSISNDARTHSINTVAFMQPAGRPSYKMIQNTLEIQFLIIKTAVGSCNLSTLAPSSQSRKKSDSRVWPPCSSQPAHHIMKIFYNIDSTLKCCPGKQSDVNWHWPWTSRKKGHSGFEEVVLHYETSADQNQTMNLEPLDHSPTEKQMHI